MEAYPGTKVKQVSFSLILISLALFFLPLSPKIASASECQFHILNVGINLGWAQATLELRGDQNPRDASRISDSLNRTIEHIRAAATLFRMPYRTERIRKEVDQRVIDKINRYFQLAAQLSIRQKVSHVRQIWSMYRQSFQTTFQSPTSGYHYYPNCDFFILDVGYHFGRAHIAAGVVNNNRARTYQTGANGSMRSAIQSGLKIAVDGYEYGTQSNARKACCCFGKEAFWRELPNFQWNSPVELYSGTLPRIQRIVLDAGVRPEPCSCGGTPLEPPSEHLSPDEFCNQKYPGSIAKGKGEDGNIICGCPEGLRINLDKSACVSEHDFARQWCNKNRPGSIPVRKPDGGYECRCPQGFVWDSPQQHRRCIKAETDSTEGVISVKVGNYYTYSDPNRSMLEFGGIVRLRQGGIFDRFNQSGGRMIEYGVWSFDPATNVFTIDFRGYFSGRFSGKATRTTIGSLVGFKVTGAWGNGNRGVLVFIPTVDPTRGAHD